MAAPSAPSSNGFTRNTLTMRSHWSPTMASISSDGDGLLGPLRGELGHDPTAHRVPGEHGRLDAQLVDGPAHQLGVVAEVAGVAGQALRAAVAGHVDGDDLEPLAHQAVEGLGVEEALGGEPVHDDQRDAPAADGEADLVAVGEGERVAGQPRHRDRGRARAARWPVR